LKRFRLFAHVLLAALAAFSAVPAVFAEPAESKAVVDREKAVSLARSYLSLTSEFELNSVNFYEDFSGKRWSLEFHKKSENGYSDGVVVSLDADTGRLIGFEKYDGDPAQQTTYPPKYDFEAAKKVAERFVREVNAAEFDQLRYNPDVEAAFRTPLQGPVVYPFRYDRVVNGIIYPENYVFVRVDGSGNVVSYQFVWDDKVEFAPATGLIDEDRAKALFQEKASVVLWLIWLRNVQNPTPRFAYEWNSSRMHARTGEIDILMDGSFEPMEKKASSPSGRFAESLTQQQAAEAMKTLLSLDDVQLANASYYEQKDAGVWNFEWRIDTAKTGGSAEDGVYYWVSVDASTGEPVSYHFSNPTKSVRPIRDDVRGKQIAADFVRRAYPARLHELAGPNGKSGVYFFQRLVDGVPVESEGIHLIVGEDGSILSLQRSFSTVSFPSAKPTVLLETEARTRLMNAYTLQLQYIREPNSPFREGIPPEKYRAILASGMTQYLYYNPDAGNRAEPYYVLVPKRPTDTGIFLDATDGKFYRRDNGKEYFLELPETSDLKGHWAEKELRLMLEYGAIDAEGGRAAPDKPITRGEMIKMLLIAMRGGWFEPSYYANERKASFADVSAGSAYFAYVEYAVDNRLIDPATERFRPDDPVTREELAVLIVRALGYAKLAEYGDLFRLDVADAGDIRHKGQVAIATGLGIMTTDEHGRFRPAETVTRAQAAVAFYRFLQKRAELQDVGPWR